MFFYKIVAKIFGELKNLVYICVIILNREAMKNYNFNKAKQLIEESKDNLASASLGMHEDWFWTAETIWEGGEYKRILPDNADELQEQYIKARTNGLSMYLKKEEGEDFAKPNPVYEQLTAHCINGIYGSGWATPTLQLCFKDGSEKMIPCHNNGESSGNAPLSWTLGVLSGPVQTNISPLTE